MMRPPRARALQLLNEKVPKLTLELNQSMVTDPRTGKRVSALDQYLDEREKWFRRAWKPLVGATEQDDAIPAGGTAGLQGASSGTSSIPQPENDRMSEKREKRKPYRKGRKADYKGAIPEQVALAVLRYRPEQTEPVEKREGRASS